MFRVRGVWVRVRKVQMNGIKKEIMNPSYFSRIQLQAKQVSEEDKTR